MKSKKLLVIAGVGATLGVVGYLYFKKNKPTISETQLKLLSSETKPQSAIDKELLSPETKPQTVSGSTLGATFSNAQTIVQNENVTVQQSSQVVSQLLDMVQQKKAEELLAELQRNINESRNWTSKYKTSNPIASRLYKRNCAIGNEITNLGYELVGSDNYYWALYKFCMYKTTGTLKKIAV